MLMREFAIEEANIIHYIITIDRQKQRNSI